MATAAKETTMTQNPENPEMEIVDTIDDLADAYQREQHHIAYSAAFARGLANALAEQEGGVYRRLAAAVTSIHNRRDNNTYVGVVTDKPTQIFPPGGPGKANTVTVTLESPSGVWSNRAYVARVTYAVTTDSFGQVNVDPQAGDLLCPAPPESSRHGEVTLFTGRAVAHMLQYALSDRWGRVGWRLAVVGDNPDDQPEHIQPGELVDQLDALNRPGHIAATEHSNTISD